MNKTDPRLAWLEGGAARCPVEPTPPKKIYRLVLLGPPGCGKGTQARLLARHLGACHLSTGDIFRARMNQKPAATTNDAKDTLRDGIAKGELVADQTVIDMIVNRRRCLRCHTGFLLDGFPRSLTQAAALDQLLGEEGLALTAVIHYDASLETIVDRLGGRRTCSNCKGVFHLSACPPKQPGLCDYCGGTLYRREDDYDQAIVARMAAYRGITAPLIQRYRAQGLLLPIKADDAPEKVFRRTLDALASKGAGPAGSMEKEA